LEAKLILTIIFIILLIIAGSILSLIFAIFEDKTIKKQEQKEKIQAAQIQKVMKKPNLI
jgi:anionic cell wall polymer biosynthesis LytR-Cps2A-Psr (LCP) family protein